MRKERQQQSHLGQLSFKSHKDLGPQKVLSQRGNQTSCNKLQERIPILLFVLDDRKNEITGNASEKPLACTALRPFWIENGQKEETILKPNSLPFMKKL